MKAQAKRTTVLLAVLGVLGVLVVYDYSMRGSNIRPSTSAGMDAARPLAQWLALVNVEDTINRAYGEAALPYAEMAVGLSTFSLKVKDPRKTLETAIRGQLPAAVEVKDLLVGEPTRQADGVYTLSARLHLTTTGDREAIQAIWALGEPAQGIAWKDYTVSVDAEQRRIDISGELDAVVVQAVE